MKGMNSFKKHVVAYIMKKVIEENWCLKRYAYSVIALISITRHPTDLIRKKIRRKTGLLTKANSSLSLLCAFCRSSISISRASSFSSWCVRLSIDCRLSDSSISLAEPKMSSYNLAYKFFLTVLDRSKCYWSASSFLWLWRVGESSSLKVFSGESGSVPRAAPSAAAAISPSDRSEFKATGYLVLLL